MDVTAQVGFGAHASWCTRLRPGRGFITDAYVAASLNAARHGQVFLPVDKVLVHSLRLDHCSLSHRFKKLLVPLRRRVGFHFLSRPASVLQGDPPVSTLGVSGMGKTRGCV